MKLRSFNQSSPESKKARKQESKKARKQVRFNPFIFMHNHIAFLQEGFNGHN